MREKSDNHDKKEECFSKWPNGKTKGLICACVQMCVHLCAAALGGCGPPCEGMMLLQGDLGSGPLQRKL